MPKSLHEIFQSKFQKVEYVGKGTFGVIASVTCIDSGESRAIKLLDSDDDKAMDEIKMLTVLDKCHSSIIRYFGTWIGGTDELDTAWQSVLKRKYTKVKSLPQVMIAIELELCEGMYNDLLKW